MNSRPQPELYSRSQHNLSKDDIDPDALKIIGRLVRNGHKAYIVGGGVRDLLLNKRPKDFDLATDATPRRVKALFRNCRVIGRRFKLAHIFFGNGKIIEVATFRDGSDPIGDEEENSLSPVERDNRYGTEWTDAFRRDITINALFFDLPTFSVIDYVGGMRDLKDEIVRVIGDPHTRFVEDPVRMLRVIRHAARAGFSIEQGCWEAITRDCALIEKSSQVRVFEELKRDLAGGHFVEIGRMLAHAGLIQYMIPELTSHPMTMFAERGWFEKLIGRVDRHASEGTPPSPAIVLACLMLAARDQGRTEKELWSLFSEEAEVDEYILQTFKTLSIPRRDREKIQHFLGVWWKLASGNEHIRKISSDIKDELEHFLTIVDPSRALWERFSGREATAGNVTGKRRRSGRRRRRPYAEQATVH